MKTTRDGDYMRECPTETGYGASTADIERGYLMPNPDAPGDGGVNEYPMPGRVGFLYRGPFLMDR